MKDLNKKVVELINKRNNERLTMYNRNLFTHIYLFKVFIGRFALVG